MSPSAIVDRPVTFVFNGGPGASSAFLHMGAVGPTRVAFPADGTLPRMPPRLVPNEESWLAFTDLVFVDPVGTGFSRVIESDSKDGEEKKKRDGSDDGDAKEYFGYKRDLESLCEFMGRWLSGHGRWGSAVFIAGESYGGYRVGRLVRMLQETTGIGLSGAVLISPALEFGSLSPTDYDVLGWVDLATDDGDRRRAPRALARVRGRHGARGGLHEAERFATGDYATLLTRGASMPAGERDRILGRLADLIGLPTDLVARAEGRITIGTVHARTAARRAEGARAVRRDDHDHRSVPRSRGVRRSRPDARRASVPRTRRRSTGSFDRRSASRPIASTCC